MPSVVLLSGGLDSVAALLLEAKRGPDLLEAVFFRYGQPMAERERESARRACEAVGTRLHELDISPAYAGFRGGLMAAPESARVSGRDTAFLPGRNALLLSLAASLACQRFDSAQLVVGFNRTDAGGFPDCRREFCEHMEATLQLGGARVWIRAPWLTHSKAQIVAWAHREVPDRLPLLERSWSCYAGSGPCERCTACLVRREAFAAQAKGSCA